MDDPHPTPAYTAVRDSLAAADAESGPAEAHGLLCGLVCARGAGDPEPWFEQILGPAPRAGAVPAPLDALWRSTRDELTGGGLSFHPLLPDDAAPLPERARALGQWGEGFLAGLGLGNLAEEAARGGEIGEFLQDVAEITRVGFAPASGEEDEAAYTEIVEYLRMGTLLVYETLTPPAAGPAGTVH